MKTLSIKQPFASLIVYGLKDVENRTWTTPYRGKILIHAGSAAIQHCFWDNEPREHFESYMTHNSFGNIPDMSEFPTGAIVGYVDLKDCVKEHDSIWADPFEDVYKWVFTNAFYFDEPILNVKGKLRLWEYPLDENNLPPAHKASPKQVEVSGDTITIPVCQDIFDDIVGKQTKNLDLCCTEELMQLICTLDNDSYNLKKGFNHLILKSPSEQQSYEIESMGFYNELDQNDNPIKDINRFGGEVDVEFLGIDVK